MGRLGFLILIYLLSVLASFYLTQVMFLGTHTLSGVVDHPLVMRIAAAFGGALPIWSLPAIVFLVANRKVRQVAGFEPYLVPMIVFTWQLGPMLIATYAYLRFHGRA
jgi:hypothetical protein